MLRYKTEAQFGNSLYSILKLTTQLLDSNFSVESESQCNGPKIVGVCVSMRHKQTRCELRQQYGLRLWQQWAAYIERYVCMYICMNVSARVGVREGWSGSGSGSGT